MHTDEVHTDEVHTDEVRIITEMNIVRYEGVMATRG
jgi:hypothetical protein